MPTCGLCRGGSQFHGLAATRSASDTGTIFRLSQRSGTRLPAERSATLESRVLPADCCCGGRPNRNRGAGSHQSAATLGLGGDRHDIDGPKARRREVRGGAKACPTAGAGAGGGTRLAGPLGYCRSGRSPCWLTTSKRPRACGRLDRLNQGGFDLFRMPRVKSRV
jgi:hypothetical protein